MYVVTGATGNTGRVIAERLLAAGKPVRVIGRNAEKLQPLVHKGAQAVVGNLEDSSILARAFEGATAVYAMIPTEHSAADYRAQQRRVGEATVSALRDARVPYAVNLSSMGAQKREGSGPVSGLGQQEERLNAIPSLHLLNIRASFFMENLYGFIGMIRAGFIATPLRPDLMLPWIATRDVGEIAAAALLELDFKGKTTRELLGQRDLSFAEATRVVGKAIGKPDLKYVQGSYEDAEKGLVQAGFSLDVARGYCEMYQAMNEGRLRPLEKRNDTNTTPTSLESFVNGLAAAIA